MALSTAKHRVVVDLDAATMIATMTIIDRESEKPVSNGVFKLGASEIHETLRPMVGLYGIKALLSDRTSDVAFGTGASPEEKMAAWGEVAELLKQGVWERERKAGAPVVSAEVEALAEIKGISVAEAQTALRKYDKATKEKILSNAKIVEKAKEIKAKREKAESLDLGDLAAEG
jgi:hypothetical protein